MPLKIVRNDITKMNTDAIVNAANVNLKMGGGVCGAIFAAAGAKELQEECDKIGRCEVGQAVITKGYKLPAKHIIHAVGPIWEGGGNNEETLLHNSYKNSLHLALEHGLKSISFPLISSGIYGYPKDQALRVAISAISEFLLDHEMEVYLVIYGKESTLLSEKLFSTIEKYIDDNYVTEHEINQRTRGIEAYDIQRPMDLDVLKSTDELIMYSPMAKESRSLDDVMDQLEDTFAEMLFRLIDERGMTDVETYKRANIDRKLFSKIRSNIDYSPSKATAIALAIALKLNLDETRDLLGKAGYALSRSNKTDLIIEFFIQNENYNVYEINEALFDFDQIPIGF
ncbi:MAG: macro domain-containing protein [Tissierellia bacterium]|nr:macro domain-containing protein [Tissierellia bacterium]